ncbi:MAG: integrin alpha [Anaerolineales bacterium]
MNKVKILPILLIFVLIVTTIPVLAQVISAVSTSPQSQIIKVPDWLFETNQVADISVLDHRQMMVASGCDVNGDGYEDVLVGDRDYDYLYARDDNGRAWLYFGNPSGLSNTPDIVFNPPYTNYYGFFGEQVACAGDVNDDGYDDILIGMDNYDNVTSDEGAVFVYYGSPTGPDDSYDWMARGDALYAHFGLSADSAGDVNGDGYDDIIVGAWRYDNNMVSHAYVWFGGASGLGPDGLPSNADWYASDPHPGDLNGTAFGLLVRGIGDVNGDTYGDVMVGAYLYDGAVTDQGAVFVYYGSDSGLGDPGTPANADWMAVSGQTDSRLGSTGADGIGDVNGDGYDDLAVGAYAYDNPEVTEGKVFVWNGSASGLGDNGNPDNADWSAEANVTSSLGYVVRSAGDVNDDGYADLLATAYLYPFDAQGEPLAGAGAWFIWIGSASGLGENGTLVDADFAGYGDQEYGRLGRDDAGAADVNNDGLSDIFVASYLYDHPELDEGIVFGYYSTPSTINIFIPFISRGP